MASPKLFTPLVLKGLHLENRIAVAPMCQYSAEDGIAIAWHDQHYGALALGGAGLVVVEATGVTPDGRISPYCLGLWNDAQTQAFTQMIKRIKSFSSAKIGIQLAHAGRKGASPRSGDTAPGDTVNSYWPVMSASAVAFDYGWQTPQAMTTDDMARVTQAFVDAARRAVAAGFDIIELHSAHGYLLHQFLSPLSNRRTDEYGGSLENRMRFPLDVIRAVRAALPAQFPLGVRVSATDWVDDGLTVDESVTYALRYAELGLDYVCVSSGGLLPKAPIPVGPGYQVGLAKALSRALKEKGYPIAVRAVGMITDPVQAESILAAGDADWVALARGMLDNPHWAWHAAKRLGVEIAYPRQYERASPRLWR